MMPFNNDETYAEVVLPLPLHATFTYHVPSDISQKVRQGHRVVVPFGTRKFYTGIVMGVSPRRPEGVDVKEIAMILDEHPVVRYPQLKYWQWLADYYMSPLGDVYKAAVPAGLKLESETFVEVNPDYDWSDQETPLSEREMIVTDMLRDGGKMSLAEVAKKTGFRNVEALASKLLDKGVAVISEKVIERYRSRKESMVRLMFDPVDKESARIAFDAVKGAKKQETMLLTMLQLSDAVRRDSDTKDVSRKDLIERSGCTSAVLLALVKKGLVEVYKRDVNRFSFTGRPSGILPVLSEAQKEALDGIHHSFLDHDVSLLHGVTSSGKTEIYIHLIDYVMRCGDQALMLVPEIALTTQLTRRLQRVFGDKVIIYHSRFSDNERVDIWRRMLSADGPCVIIGARSAVFLPFSRLGIVIVDEEHEGSYKQYDPAPRYNGRDAAIVLATMHGAKTLLGSATPSIETYYKARSGKWGFVELTERYEGAALPEIEVIDMMRARRSGAASGAFARSTVEMADAALSRKEQVIFFHNRRGYAPMARCKQCAWTPKCEHCDVSLTVHRRLNQLVCHYCGAMYPIPSVCPSCHEPSIEIIGYGTERVEDEVEERFPSAKMLRMDLDTTRNKDAYENIIEDFSAHKADILVGTQMVTKGLDFGDVSLVGVLNADAIINFPDFRSTERAFNMLAQVSGRAGRREGCRGKVVVQTAQPGHPVIGFLQAHDFQGYYDYEIGERERFLYPPFTRVIYIYLKHRDAHAIGELSMRYGSMLRGLLGNRVFGPEEPHVGRIQSMYIRKIMIKLEIAASPKRVKDILRQAQLDFYGKPDTKGLIVYYDVDPQ